VVKEANVPYLALLAIFGSKGVKGANILYLAPLAPLAFLGPREWPPVTRPDRSPRQRRQRKDVGGVGAGWHRTACLI